VSGRRPELWHADFGEIEKLALWREEGGRTEVSLSFDPAGSLFVLFAQPTAGKPFFTAICGVNSDEVRLGERGGQLQATVSRAGNWVLRNAGGDARDLKVGELPEALALGGPWKVQFTERVDRPVELTLNVLSSWTDRPERDVKYYSGTAKYMTDFELPTAMQAGEHRLFLELGEVHDLVEVQVNRQVIATLWKPPFTADITRAVRVGSNKLELAVTNTWRNRLIGDFGKTQAERKGFVFPFYRLGKPWLPGGPGTVLTPAGLLGPVRVRYAAVVSVT
jgi:hypothetical protein